MSIQNISVAAVALLAVATVAACGTGAPTSADDPADAAAETSDLEEICAGFVDFDLAAFMGGHPTSGPTALTADDNFPSCRATVAISDNSTENGHFSFKVGTKSQIGYDPCNPERGTPLEALAVRARLIDNTVESDLTALAKDWVIAGVPTLDGRCAALSGSRITDGVDNPFSPEEIAAAMRSVLEGAGIAY